LFLRSFPVNVNVSPDAFRTEGIEVLTRTQASAVSYANGELALVN